MLDKKIKLSVVIPARNEEENIENTVSSLIPFLNPSETEIIIVNDHSEDKTEEIGKELSEKYSFVKIVNNEKEPGFANALITGFENSKGEFVLPVMADMCDCPATIPEMVKKAEEGFDIVCGSRYMKGGKKIGGPKLQGFFSFFVCKSLKWLINLPTYDVSNAFKLYRKKIFERIKPKEKGFAISMEITLKAYFSGYRISEVPTIWKGREKGKSKFKISKTFPYVKLYFWAILKKWKFL
ncbi:glycosyltransferase family 2 protein [bacterium]|nr:glycosyltransferase family 2 protein [bacterium]